MEDILNLNQPIASREAFTNTQTGAILSDNPTTRQLYRQQPDKFLLPTSLHFIANEFVPNPDLRGKAIEIEFVKTGKNRGYVVDRISTERIRFYYHDEEDLQNKIYDMLQDLNQDYDPNERYETDTENGAIEWWVKTTLDMELGGAGYNMGRVRNPTREFAPRDQFQFNFGQPTFNGLRVKYELPFLDKNYKDVDDDRCCWNYLKNYMEFDTDLVKKWIGKEPTENTWSWDDLKMLAEKKRISLNLFDVHGEPYRKWINKDEYEIYTYTPEKRSKSKGMAFMYVDNHIYPYAQVFQKKKLQKTFNKRNLTVKKYIKLPETEKCFYDMSESGDFKKQTTLSQLKIDNMKEGEKKTITQESLNNLKEYWSDYKIIDKWDITHFKDHKHLFVKVANLDDVMRDLYDKTQTIYQHKTDSREHINYIFSPNEGWRIYASLNIDDVKPALEQFGMVYKGEDINKVGELIYNSMTSEDSMSKLKSATLGTIFTVERGFNHTTEWLQEYGDKNSYYKELQDYQMKKNVCDVLQKYKNRIYKTDGVKASELEKPKKHDDYDFHELGNVMGLDFNKFYSHQLENPFSPFLKYTEFDNIEDFKQGDKLDYGYYYCEIDEELKPEEYLPFAQNKNGWFCWKVVDLARYYNIKFRIIKKFIPKRENILKQDHFKKFVDEVYKKAPNSAKYIINAFIGNMCRVLKEKVYTNSTIITDNDADKAYMIYKGYTLSPFKEPSKELPGLYSVNQVKTIDKRDGWISIGKQILQEAKVRLELLKRSIQFNIQIPIYDSNMLSKEAWRNLPQKENKLGFKRMERTEQMITRQYENYKKKFIISSSNQTCIPILYKTDSIVLADLNKGDLQKAIENVDFGSNRGQVRIEYHIKVDDEDKSKLFNLTNNKFKIVKETTAISTSHIREQYVYDNPEAVDDLITRKQSFRVDGMAGTGKSHLTINKIIPNLKKKGFKYVLTATTHQSAHNSMWEKVNEKGCTIHSLLKYSPNCGVQDFRFSHLKELDYIIIDECSMLPHAFYKYLQRIKLYHPNINIILIGDYNQIPPVGDELYDIRYSNILSWICDYNLIHLKKNMRSGVEGERMFNWYNDLIKDNPNQLTDKRLFQSEHFPFCQTQLSYTNDTRKFVNWFMCQGIKSRKHVLSLLLPIKNPRYLRCGIWKHEKSLNRWACQIRSTKNTDNYYNNQEFIIIDKEDDQFLLRDVITEDTILVPEDEIAKYFDYNWCKTIHKAQGSSIDNEYIIWDWKFIKDSRLKYVAVSRTKKLNNIHIIKYEPYDFKEYDSYVKEYGVSLELK